MYREREVEKITNMDVISSFWRRRRYQRLNKPRPSTRPKRKAVRLGSRRAWKALRARMPSPRELLVGVMNIYLDGMMAFAMGGGGRPTARNGGVAAWRKRMPDADQADAVVDGGSEREMLQYIYNNIMV